MARGALVTVEQVRLALHTRSIGMHCTACCQCVPAIASPTRSHPLVAAAHCVHDMQGGAHVPACAHGTRRQLLPNVPVPQGSHLQEVCARALRVKGRVGGCPLLRAGVPKPARVAIPPLSEGRAWYSVSMQDAPGGCWLMSGISLNQPEAGLVEPGF